MDFLGSFSSNVEKKENKHAILICFYQNSKYSYALLTFFTNVMTIARY